ncbi:MAG TPA: zinc-dependent alcohol dehydrogenase family protein [Stellaceae bacterium]|nr:zinc-dependent alcohol dehydrogenase family protein [Stellaceae bacterium]
MHAQVLTAAHQALVARDLPPPRPAAGQVLIAVKACAVCRTDLHIVDGELTRPKLPLVPGHEIVGTVIATGPGAERFATGDRVGVPWLGWTCGVCDYCTSGRENLCDRARFTGYQIDGGYAELTVADERFCFALPAAFDDVAAAPLLCAGLIGYRTLRLASESTGQGAKQGERIGIYGFGAAAHIVAQVARFQGRRVFAFTKPGDRPGQDFARGLGAVWAGGSDEAPPEPLDAALIFAPVGALVPAALRATRKGGAVVCGGIHMSDIPAFPYALLWEERIVRSVANLTRRDAEEFLALAPQAGIVTATTPYKLAEANRALEDLRHGRLEGAAVLVP